MRLLISYGFLVSIGIVCIQSVAIASNYHPAIHYIHPLPGLKKAPTPDDPFGPGSASKSKTINGVTVPDDFPDITTEKTGETSPGLIFLTTRHGVGEYFVIINDEGEIYYYLKSEDGDFGNATVHPNNVLSLYCYSGYYWVFDSTFTIIDTIYGADSHELQFLENGHRLSFFSERTGCETMQEFDTEENVIFEWNSCDYLADYPHINSIDVDFDGHYILSIRDFDEVIKLNRNTGEIIWHLGGEKDMFTYLNDELRLSQQHDARPVRDHPNHYLIYDNGKHRAQTRVVEYRVDTLNWTVEKVWEFTDSEHFSQDMGSSQRFENGNTFIDFPHPETHALEVNPAGEIVFSMNSPGHTNYRNRRYNWFGKMKFPMLLLEDKPEGEQLIFNQFGDTTISYYKIYSGSNKNNLHLLDTTKNTYYNIFDLQDYEVCYFGVTSVNREGVESNLSKIVKVLIHYSGSMENIVLNGDFSLPYQNWMLKKSVQAQASGIYHEGKFKVEIDYPGTSLSDITVTQDNITLIKGKKYVFEFDAYADQDRIIEPEVRKIASPFTNYSRIGKTYLSTTTQHFRYEFVMEEYTDANAILIFNLGKYNGDVILDNISLKYLDENINPDLVSYARVNFHVPHGNSPSIYSSDTGMVYGYRGDDLTYGWLSENNNSVLRDTLIDTRLLSFNYLKKDNVEYTWEIEVPNGPITAKIAMGDPLSTNQINEIYVEDFLLADSDGEDNYDEVYVNDIEVKDGKLTIKPGPNALNTKIAYIELFHYKPEVLISPSQSDRAGNHDLTIYPVPASDILNIQLTLAHSNSVEIELVDMLGRIVDEHPSALLEPGTHEMKFDISSLSTSVYFVRCSIDGEKLNRKIIVH